MSYMAVMKTRTPTWQQVLLRKTFGGADKRPTVIPSKKHYSRKGRKARSIEG